MMATTTGSPRAMVGGFTAMAALALGGCIESKAGGVQATAPSYVSCRVDADCPGGARCVGEDPSDTACVPLVDACEGVISCACLGAEVCGEASCVDGADGNSLTCETLYDPCAGAACGDSCSPCPPDAVDCGSVAVEMVCDRTGQCVTGDPSELCAPPPACCDPATRPAGQDEPPLCCADGNWYSNPGDGDPAVCAPYGGLGEECTAPPPYDACAGKGCGDECNPCAPDDIACHRRPSLPHACDAAGQCVSDDPAGLGCEGTQPVQCEGAELFFPSFDGACAGDGDCVAVLHQVDCCGTYAVLGVPGADVAAFEAAEATCVSQYPQCQCASGPHTADDGTASWSLDDFAAVCVDGRCRSVGTAPGCSSAQDCGSAFYCDFAGDGCGTWDQLGACTPRPQACDAGGTGACSCYGASYLNDCEAAAAGVDVMRFGGCDLSGAGTFACGESACEAGKELCRISFNDVVGENEPEYFASCGPLPESCPPGQATCDCVVTDPFEDCWHAQGAVIVFYPGG